ncbi:MAG: response regulator transcription factor [Chloroflexi bacterium]|nr:response regulator transcription factor [Chloroflexota bacterium]MBK6712030.1 response regulator transcription factor [Chloroflexota bacterium]MBK7177372.1 response regulator transcription factor [Chloroflexota bacterium]MBK7919693.1 response regulator transcription factor [Chloroflexota bacterium]MBK8932011.1 response regulator transcription factor [Chloroflexota bacterium]
MSKIKLLLADDHAVVRSGLRMLLEAQPDMEIVAEAENGRETIEKVLAFQPDIVLMDIEMPGMNGIEATRKIKEESPETAVLALTMYEDDQYFFEMLKAGAAGYIPKRAAPDALVNAIRTVKKGEVFLYPSMAAYLVEDYLQRDEAPEEDEADVVDLTTREREVLVLIAEGLSNGEISEKLVISIKTVDRHRENIMRKLNIHNRIDLVKFALKKGMIDLDD